MLFSRMGDIGLECRKYGSRDIRLIYKVGASPLLGQSGIKGLAQGPDGRTDFTAAKLGLEPTPYQAFWPQGPRLPIVFEEMCVQSDCVSKWRLGGLSGLFGVGLRLYHFLEVS